jgi:NADPH2:quinone reductase
MTRIIKIEKTGGPEVLKLATINLEKPAQEEVTIEHKAIGLNFIDTYHRSGLYPIELPSSIGVEATGIIKEIGSKVEGFSVGDSVAYAGAPLGAYSSERNYPVKNLIKVPAGINLEVVATLMTKGLTAYYLLYKTYPVSSNETILFHAAAGGVGQVFCQWAKSLGCKVIGTVGSDDKISIAKNNGCDFVINYSKDDFAKKVLEFTKGKGVPVVYDGVGKNTFHKSIECLKTRGMMVSFGNASGSLENIDVKKSIQPKGLYFTRPSMWHYLSTQDELKVAADIMFEKIKFGQIKINIFKKYRLDDVKQAHEDLESRKIVGSAIIIP